MRWAVISAITFVGLCGCRRDEPPPKPSTPTPEAPKPKSGPVSLRPQPAAAPAANNRPPAISATPQSVARAGDPQDAPGTPTYLPRNGDVSGWTKRDPVSVVPAADLGKLVTPEHAKRLSRFNLRSAAACSYQMKLGERDLVANILAIEAATPQDAFGLVTCSCSSPETDRCGGMTRVDPGPPVRFHTWQGRVAIQASFNATGPEQVAEMRRLVQHIVSRVQREDEPLLVHAFPQQDRIPGRLWLARSVLSLPPEAVAIATPPDLDATARLLNLNSDAMIGVAAYSVPGARQPNTVWVVQYPTTEQAKQAYLKLNAQIASGGNPAWQNTNVMPPKGPYLVGTWTAEEESLQYMMPKIAALLPRS